MDSREIGKALGVATLLEGSVRKAGNRVRISARLVSAADGYQLWSEAFDRALGDIFAIQEEIAQAVVRALELRLSASKEARLTRIGTRDAQAYEMYLRGRKFLMMHGETSLRLARQVFRGAIELDPRFAQAHAGLADADFFMLQWNLDHERAAERRAEALAESEEALRLNPDLAEAHVSRGNVLSLHGRGEEAERDFHRALELNPAQADACYFYARHLRAAGRRREAAGMFEEAARRDPGDFASLGLLVDVYTGLGERDSGPGDRPAMRRGGGAAPAPGSGRRPRALPPGRGLRSPGRARARAGADRAGAGALPRRLHDALQRRLRLRPGRGAGARPGRARARGGSRSRFPEVDRERLRSRLAARRAAVPGDPATREVLTGQTCERLPHLTSLAARYPGPP